MKITDISSSLINNHASDGEQEAPEEGSGRRKRTLLEKFNIPIEHVDFSYVKTCNDAREVERILRVLKSGEEGSYPDLQRFVEERLEKLNPNSRLLRVELPVLHTKELNQNEQEAINTGLAEWISDLSEQKEHRRTSKKQGDIFDFEENIHESFPLPVRGSSAQVVTELKKTQFTPDKNAADKSRIKSWEYDKWDKFDVDAELTKLDITDMQQKEWEKVEKPKLIEEQKKVEKLMKPKNDERANPKVAPQRENGNCDRSQSKKGRTNTSKNIINTDTPSYIEEVDENDDDDDDEKGTSVTTQISSRFRKTKIVIDDLNLGM
ncbi:Sperm-associated antigen 1 [Orchesella cincta]|uniref:Sperm-associated antigen 1 n=1 Tax=Orchesella cincta TaxID=48709 RepID=A0A1D2NK62_ORCCI|nr:Sperm-associated antigen 1 [Orchesella cincta]